MVLIAFDFWFVFSIGKINRIMNIRNDVDIIRLNMVNGKIDGWDELTENGSSGFENWQTEIAPSVGGFSADLKSINGLLTQAAECRFGSVDEHAAGVVLVALHEITHFIHFDVRVRIIGRVPAQCQLRRTDVGDAYVRHGGRNGRFCRDGDVDELVLVGRHLLRDSVVGKDLEPVRCHRVQS